jgi:hypothetical protein
MVMSLARAVGYPEPEKKSLPKAKRELLMVKETKRKYKKK